MVKFVISSLYFTCVISCVHSRLLDLTLPLMGHTIYIESLYYPGWWVGASDSYNGALFQLSEVTACQLEPCIPMVAIE